MHSAKFLVVILLVCFLFAAGVAGYMVIEKWDFMDSAFMTAISLTTVGYSEVHPLSTHGRLFTIILITAGVGLFFYALTALSEAVVEGQIKGYLEKKKMQKAISNLSSHYILCGYGRLGCTIARSFASRGLPLVIIDNDPEIAETLRQTGYLYLQGDATSDEILLGAGVKRAKSIICTLNSDAANVYVVLIARSMNPDIFILARASEMNVEKRMIQAGADKVVTPYEIGAKRMVLAALQPTVIEFLDLATDTTGLDLNIEEIRIQPGSAMDGVSLLEIALREKTGVNVLGVHHEGTGLSMDFSPSEILKGGDTIVAMGTKEGLKKVRQLAGVE